MKTTVLILIAFLLTSNVIFSQKGESELIKSIWEEEINWSIRNFEKLDVEEEEFVYKNLKYGCGNKNQRADLKRFYKKDLNEDGLLDLLYKGSCPYSEISIFLNTGNGYEKVLSSFFGSIQRIETESKQTKIFIYQEACCCIRTNSICELTILSNQYEVSRVKYLRWDSEFDIPEQMNEPSKTEKELNEKVVLRTNLMITDHQIKDDCQDIFYRGNRLGELQKGAKYRVVSTKEDKQGDEWVLIEVLSNSDFEVEENSVQYYDKANSVVIGWMKKRTL